MKKLLENLTNITTFYKNLQNKQPKTVQTPTPNRP